MATVLGAKFTISAEDQTQSAVQSINRSLKSMEESLSLFKEAAEAIAIGEVIGKVLEEVGDSEKAFAILQSQVKATGGAAGYTAEQLRTMAESLEQTSTFSHTQIEQAQGELLAFTSITGKNFQDLIKVSMDFATVTGRDLPSAVKTLGEAVGDPATSLGRLKQAGVELTEQQKQQIETLAKTGHLYQAQALLIQDLEHSYGGAAQAVRNTFGGALEGLKNQFADLLEGNDGSFDQATASINDLSKTLASPQIKEGFATLISGLATLVSWTAKVAEGFANLGKDIGEFFAKMQGYKGGFDEQITDLKGHIEQTQQQIDGLTKGGTPKDSPAIQQLERQLAQYKYQLQDIQLYQKTVLGGDNTPKAATPQAAPHVAPVSYVDPKKVEEAQHSVQAMINSLQKETATFGENKEAVMRYEVAHGELADKLKLMGAKGQEAAQQLIALAAKEDQLKASAEKAKEALDAQNDRIARATQLVEALNPKLKLQDTEASLQDLVGTTVDGVTVTKQMVQQYAVLGEQGKKTNDQLTSFGDEAARNIQDNFAKFLFDPFKDGLKGMVRSFAESLEKMLDNIIAAQLMDHLFGSNDPSGKGNGQSGFANAISSGLQSYFGGGHAEGGDVNPNQFYLVGEEGPELFAPKGSGSIIPNKALLSGGGGQGYSGPMIHIDARGAGPDEVAKLLAMEKRITNNVKGQVSARLQRGNWMR